MNNLEFDTKFCGQRQKLLAIFANEVYGEIPPSPKKIEADEKIIEGRNYCGGHAQLYKINLIVHLRMKVTFRSPLSYVYLNTKERRKLLF